MGDSYAGSFKSDSGYTGELPLVLYKTGLQGTIGELGLRVTGIGHWLHHGILHTTPGDGVVLVRSEHCECAAASCSRVC